MVVAVLAISLQRVRPKVGSTHNCQCCRSARSTEGISEQELQSQHADQACLHRPEFRGIGDLDAAHQFLVANSNADTLQILTEGCGFASTYSLSQRNNLGIGKATGDVDDQMDGWAATGSVIAAIGLYAGVALALCGNVAKNFPLAIIGGLIFILAGFLGMVSGLVPQQVFRGLIAITLVFEYFASLNLLRRNDRRRDAVFFCAMSVGVILVLTGP